MDVSHLRSWVDGGHHAATMGLLRRVVWLLWLEVLMLRGTGSGCVCSAVAVDVAFVVVAVTVVESMYS